MSLAAGATAFLKAASPWGLGLVFLWCIFEVRREYACRALLVRAEGALQDPMRSPVLGFSDATRAGALGPAWGSCRARALALKHTLAEELASPALPE